MQVPELHGLHPHVLLYDSLFAGDDKVVTTPEQCIGCELCQNVCGFDAITMVEREEPQMSIGAVA